jgi:hypothetical protein
LLPLVVAALRERFIVCRANAANCCSTSQKKKPSQTLSPRPWWPTSFMPSFQSPVPISGRPCAP